jgi:hypothetical protein
MPEHTPRPTFDAHSALFLGRRLLLVRRRRHALGLAFVRGLLRRALRRLASLGPLWRPNSTRIGVGAVVGVDAVLRGRKFRRTLHEEKIFQVARALHDDPNVVERRLHFMLRPKSNAVVFEDLSNANFTCAWSGATEGAFPKAIMQRSRVHRLHIAHDVGHD